MCNPILVNYFSLTHLRFQTKHGQSPQHIFDIKHETQMADSIKSPQIQLRKFSYEYHHIQAWRITRPTPNRWAAFGLCQKGDYVPIIGESVAALSECFRCIGCQAARIERISERPSARESDSSAHPRLPFRPKRNYNIFDGCL